MRRGRLLTRLSGPQQIVLAHANLPPISHVLPQLAAIIASRGLQTVTLDDVFS